MKRPKPEQAQPETPQPEPAKSNGKRPTHTVFLVEGDGDKAFWNRIGAAWEHQDGDGFSLELVAIPLTGRLVVRKAKPQQEREATDATLFDQR